MRYAIWNDFVSTDVERIERPTESEQVSKAILEARRRGKHLKAVGAGHSFNDLALNEDILIDISRLGRIIEIDEDARTVRVQAGVSLRALIAALTRLGWALPNVGAWTEQTLAGVISTATHGTSGRYRKTLIESVVRLRLVDGLGEERVLQGDDLKFLTLGFFGVITEATLRCEPLFYLRQSNQVLDGEEAISNLEAQLARHDFVDLRWVGSIPRIILRRWDRVEAPPAPVDRITRGYEGAKLAALNGFLSLVRTRSLPAKVAHRLYWTLGEAYVRGGKGFDNTAVWNEALTFNSLGIAAPHEEREFAVPLDRAEDCLRTLRALMLQAPEASGIEIQIRFSKAVDITMAPNSGRETMWFNLNVLNPTRSTAIVERVSRAIYEFDARPHWAKIIPASTPKLSVMYGEEALRWEDRRKRFDPDGVFLNAWYHRHIDYVPSSLPEQEEDSTFEASAKQP